MKENKNIDRIFKKLEHSENPYFPGKDRIWDHIESQLDDEPSSDSSFKIKKWMVAASVLLLGILAVFWLQTYENQINTNSEAVEQESYVIELKNQNTNTVTDSVSMNAEALMEKVEIEKEYEDLLPPRQEDEVYAYENVKNNTPYVPKPFDNNGFWKVPTYNEPLPNMSQPNVSQDTLMNFDKKREVTQSMNADYAMEMDIELADDFMPTQDNTMLEESAISARKNSVREKDFYFIDGQAVKKREMKNSEVQEMSYLSHEEAAVRGYISFYVNGNPDFEVIEVIHWKLIDSSKVEKIQLPIILEQLNTIDDSQFNNQEKKQLQKLKVTISKRLNP